MNKKTNPKIEILAVSMDQKMKNKITNSAKKAGISRSALVREMYAIWIEYKSNLSRFVD